MTPLKRCIAFVPAVIIAWGVAPAGAAGEFSSGPWHGKPLFKNAEFTHCGMIAAQGEAKLLLSQDQSGRIKLGLAAAALNFEKGVSKPGTLQVDGGPLLTRTFIAAGKRLAVTGLGSASEAPQLLSGRRLTVRLGDLSAAFPIDSVGPALAQLAACVAKRGAR
jgi:hypothetical protein